VSWPEVPLRRVFRIVNGGTPTAEPTNWDGDVPWATPVDIGLSNGKTLSETQRTLTPAGVASGSRAAPSGSILLSTRAPIGYVSLAGTEVAFNQGCRALTPSTQANTRYFAYQLEALGDQLQARGQGSTFVELSSEQLAGMPVRCPPTEEQRRIADFLDAETRKIDELARKRSRQLALLAERDQAALDRTLVLGDDDLVALARTCMVQTGVTLDEGKRRENFVTRPYLRVANVQADGLLLDEVKEIDVDPRDARRTTLQVGDVLMTEGGDLDKLGRGTVWNGEFDHCLHQNHVFAVRPDGRLSSDYLALLTRTSMARSYFEMTGSKTTNLASTSSSKILGFKAPLPPRQEQLARARAAHRALEVSRQAAEALRGQLSLLAERRHALITAAVTGQLDVTTARSGVRP
jgi:type I restriction enzyme S subunit